MSFITGEYPNLLKIVKVIPIHKGGSTQDVNNYRPIPLLSIFDKIIEKLMHKRLYNFFMEHNILYQNQFGFSGVVVSMFDFHRSNRGSNPSRGSKIS